MPRTKRKKQKYIEADDYKESVGFLLKLRLPWLLVGLIAGFGIAFSISNFEHILSQNVQVAFFIPVIVYLSDAVATQTETIYVRNSEHNKSAFRVYFIKEPLIGVLMGIIFGVLATAFAYIWLKDISIAGTVGLAMAISVSVAPIVALIMAKIMQMEHQDPAVGAGPITTAIQDHISILIYFFVATTILFK